MIQPGGTYGQPGLSSVMNMMGGEDLPLQIQLVPVPSPPPTEEFIKAAEDHVPHWLEDSYEFVQTKVLDWRRLELLFKNLLPMNYWNSLEDLDVATASRTALNLSIADEDKDWQSQICLGIADLVLSYTDNAFKAIFSGENWLKVFPTPKIDQVSIEDAQYSTSEKFQAEMLRLMKESKIRARIYEALMFSALFDTVFCKCVWVEKQVPRFYNKQVMDPYSGQVVGQQPITRMETINARPEVQICRPDTVLVDRHASNNDVQTWTGIGHTEEITWETCVGRFRQGVFNVGEDAFYNRWPESPKSDSPDTETRIAVDPDKDTGSTEAINRNLRFWEYHGIIPTTDGQEIESVCVYLTDRTSAEPTGGVMVRLNYGTALQCGLRPFGSAQYTQWPGPYGLGVAQPQLDLVWLASHMLNLMVDNLRITINSGHKKTQNLDALNPNGIKVQPGYQVVVEKPDDYLPIQQPSLDYGALLRAWDIFQLYLTKRTGGLGSDLSRGSQASHEQTALEVHTRSEMLSGPISNRLEIFRETFLDPILTIALAMVQENSESGKQIPIKDAQGNVQYAQMSLEEIQSGSYSVTATLGGYDSARLARGQTLVQLLPQIREFVPDLNSEAQKISFTAVFRAIFSALAPDDRDNIMQAMTPEERQAMAQMQQQMQMQQGPMGPGGPGGPPGGPGGGPIRSDQQQQSDALQQQSADLEGRTMQQ